MQFTSLFMLFGCFFGLLAVAQAMSQEQKDESSPSHSYAQHHVIRNEEDLKASQLWTGVMSLFIQNHNCGAYGRMINQMIHALPNQKSSDSSSSMDRRIAEQWSRRSVFCDDGFVYDMFHETDEQSMEESLAEHKSMQQLYGMQQAYHQCMVEQASKKYGKVPPINSKLPSLSESFGGKIENLDLEH